MWHRHRKLTHLGIFFFILAVWLNLITFEWKFFFYLIHNSLNQIEYVFFTHINPPVRSETFIFWRQFVCLLDPTAVSCKNELEVLIVYLHRCRAMVPRRLCSKCVLMWHCLWLCVLNVCKKLRYVVGRAALIFKCLFTPWAHLSNIWRDLYGVLQICWFNQHIA